MPYSIHLMFDTLSNSFVSDFCIILEQVLFPYETFVNYFNWDKPTLAPCGLTNCGNRFFFVKANCFIFFV